MMTKRHLPPFLAGRAAHAQGLPIEANPFDQDEAFEPEDYPGRYENWRSGWLNRKWMMEHDAKKVVMP